LINETGVPGGRFIQGDYTIANLAFGVSMAEWTAELFIDNVADESGAVYVDTQNFTPKVVTNRPRTVGLRLSYDF
jgi:outer membrane receptor protein involved in Fe transport